MNRLEKIAFVNELCSRMALDLANSIQAGKVPDDWDGHELRVLIADKAVVNAGISTIRKEPKSQRAKDYENHILITNL